MKRMWVVLVLAALVGCGGSTATGPDAVPDVATAAGPDDPVTDVRDGDCWVSDDGRHCGPDDPVTNDNDSPPFAGRQ